MARTKGRIEAEVSDAIVRFEKEYMGRGPVEAKAYLLDDMVIVRLQGVITQAEKHLSDSGDDQTGRELIKQTRRELIEKARPLLEAAVRDIVGAPVQSLHTDISTRTGERLIVFTLGAAPRIDAPGRPSGPPQSE